MNTTCAGAAKGIELILSSVNKMKGYVSLLVTCHQNQTLMEYIIC